MKNLSSRKQFLIAENDLSRLQLIEDFHSMSASLHTITSRADSFKSVASSAALLVTGLAAFQRGRRENAGTKSSWLQSLVKGAGLASTVWLALQMPRREGRDS